MSNFRRLVHERMAQTGETYVQARSQLQPRANSIRHYARRSETVIEALERAYRSDLPVIAYRRAYRRATDDGSGGPERVTMSAALQLIRDDQVKDFAVLLDGREVPL
jgi:hypothetical protein